MGIHYKAIIINLEIFQYIRILIIDLIEIPYIATIKH